MISFDVHFDLPTNILAQPATRTEHALAEIIRKDTEQYLPFLTGSLSNNTKVDGGTIIYPGPYARYLYYGKLMVDPDTGSAWASEGATKVLANPEKDLDIKKGRPQSQSHWFEVSKANNLQDWIEAEGKLMKRELG